MDSKQFIASLVSSLAWPTAVVCIAVLFRTQLKTLLTDRLRHIEAGPLKADFDRVGSQVEVSLGKEGIVVPDHPNSDDLTELSKQAPEVVIAEAFGLIEKELRDALEARGETLPSDAAGQTLARLAVERSLISPLTHKAIEGVAVMRNLAVHGPRREISIGQVDEYLALVESVLYAIRQNVAKH